MTYIKLNLQPGDVLSKARIDQIETQYDAARVDMNGLLNALAQHSVNIWSLEAQLLSARESMSGWQGEAFLTHQDEIAARDSHMRLSRGAGRGDGFVEGVVSTGFSTDPTKLTPPTTAQAGYSAAWSKDGAYLAVQFNSAPYLRVFKRIEDDFTELTVPATTGAPITTTVRMSWGYDAASGAEYLVVPLNVTPWFDTYKRVGDTITKLAAPAALTGAAAITTAWSADGVYLAVGHAAATSVYFSWYKRAGDVLTKLSNPASVPAGITYDAVWSADGVYLFLASSITPFFWAYKRAGDVLTKLTTPTLTVTNNATRVSRNSDSSVLLVGTDLQTTPYTITFDNTTDSFSIVTGKFAAFPGAVKEAKFSPNDQWVVISYGGAAPYMGLYQYNKAAFTFTAVSPNPFASLSASPNTWDWETTSTYLAAGMYGISPGYNVWRGNGSGADVASTSLTLKTKTLPTTCNAVYVLDEFVPIVGVGTTREYQISLNGGTTWDTVPEANIGKLVNINHSGTSLVVKLVIKHALGDTSKAHVVWLAAFATYTGV